MFEAECFCFHFLLKFQGQLFLFIKIILMLCVVMKRILTTNNQGKPKQQSVLLVVCNERLEVLVLMTSLWSFAENSNNDLQLHPIVSQHLYATNQSVCQILLKAAIQDLLAAWLRGKVTSVSQYSHCAVAVSILGKAAQIANCLLQSVTTVC